MMGHMLGSGFYGGNWDSMPDYMKQMMQGYYGGMKPFMPFSGFVHLISWIVVMALLIAAVRYLWNKGGKK